MVRQAVVDDRQDAWVAQQHFIDTARRRVAVVGGQHIGVEQHAQARQGGGEALHQAQRMGIDAGQLALALPCGVAQLQAGLGQQGGQRGIQGMADVEVFAFFAQVDRAKAHGEQRAAQLLQDVPHRFARRQLTPALLAAAAAIAGTPLFTGTAQAGDDALQLPVPG
ncbi:hypothetical protein D3C79_762960 [compost metagenome]